MSADFSKLKRNRSQKDILLGGLFLMGGRSTVSGLREKLKAEGVLKTTNKWNISNILGRATDYTILKDRRFWELTEHGQRYVEEQFGFNERKQTISNEIKDILSEIGDRHPCYEYVKEFGGCFDSGYSKAALIMAWSGAIWLLKDYVVAEKLNDFNRCAKQRPSEKKWKNVNTVEDFEKHKDVTFLDVCREAGIFSKSFMRKIDPILSLRNECSHPFSVETGNIEIINAIEFLVLNVYKKYGIS